MYVWLVLAVPLACALSPVFLVSSPIAMFATLVVAPVTFVLTYVLTAGLLSLLHRRHIVCGKFRRDTADKAYYHRRLYGLLWTLIYYNKLVYLVALTVPTVKWMLFRLFGYRGSMAFWPAPVLCTSCYESRCLGRVLRRGTVPQR